MSDTDQSDETTASSASGGRPPKRRRYDPNISQFQTNFIPGTAFGHQSGHQLSVRSQPGVRKRDHLLNNQQSVDSTADGYDSDETVIDETFADTVDDWRNGPAKYWYDIMGLPEDCVDYDYGLKLRDKTNDDLLATKSTPISLDSEDSFNLVSQIHWERDVIWDSDVVAQQVMKKAKKAEMITGWLPIGSRLAPDFVKQVECPVVQCFSYVAENCGQSVINECNTKEKSNNLAKIVNKSKDNSKTTINGLSKNLRKRKSTDIKNEKTKPLEVIVPPKKTKKRWVSTLAEENRELVYNLWENEVIWDTEAMDRKLEPKIIPFSGDDDNVIISLSECVDNEDTNDSQMADPCNESTDMFNISNDEFYASVVKVDNNPTHDLIIRHSIPATKLASMLFPTCLQDLDRPLLKRSKTLRSRCEHEVIICSEQQIETNANQPEDQNQIVSRDLTQFTINTISELTARNGEVVLMEYSEDDPTFLMRVGMGSKIINYFKKTQDKCCVPLEDKYSELRVVTNSPFIGEIDLGKSQLSFETNMFRSPIFQHSCPDTDFLIIRTDDNYYIREVNGMYAVGQQLPLMEVPRPKSKHYYDFGRQFVKMFIYRYFNGRKSVKISDFDAEIYKAFPNVTKHFVKRIINDYTIKNLKTDRYELKSQIPFDNQVNNLLTPENCCAYYTTTIAAHKLKQKGYGDRLYLNSDNNCDNQLDELAIAPWNTTVSYIGTVNSKKWLTVSDYNEDGSLVFTNQSYKDFKDQMPTIKRCIPISDLSLKRMTIKRAHEWLLNYGLAKERVKKLKNVTECSDLIRKLSNKLRESGFKTGMTRSATTEQHYKLECQKVFNLQTSYYSSKESYSTDEEEDDEEEDDEECDSDIEDMGRDLEAMIVGNKTIEQIENQREEEGRRELMKALRDGKSVNHKKDESRKESLKGKILVINRIYETNGKRELRREIVRRREVIEAYVRIRKTQTPEFIKNLDFVGNVSENGKNNKSKSKSKTCPKLATPSTTTQTNTVFTKLKPHPNGVQNVPPIDTTNGQNRGESCDYKEIDLDDDDEWDIVESTVEARQPLVRVEGNKLKFSRQVVIEANEIENEEQRRLKEEEEEELRMKTVEYFQNRTSRRCRVDPMVKLKEIFDKLIVTARKREDLSECIDFFNERVKEKEVPDYYNVIKTPMDLSTIRLHISEGQYWTRQQFMKDVEIIYENSVEYNGAVHEITQNAQKLIDFCNEYLDERAEQIKQFETMLAASDYHHILKHINT